MGVREEHAPRRETIDIRCLRLWVSAEAADPIVEVVDGNEEDVWPGRLGIRFPDEEKRKDANGDDQ